MRPVLQRNIHSLHSIHSHETFLMSRPLHLVLCGRLYHVTSRGDRREDIYRDDKDRETWLETLAQCGERYHWALHAWYQMTDH